MIKVILQSGPLAGRERTFKKGGEPVNPAELFASLVSHGWQWETDYSRATEGEILLWFREELAARVLRALRDGRPVKFLGAEYRAKKESILEVGQAIEDAIVASGRLVTIDADDEQGLVVGVRGYEQ